MLDKSARFGNLDQLRGIAALSVMIAHLSALTIREDVAKGVSGVFLDSLQLSSQDYANFGRIGVIVFFFISGYLIPFCFSGTSPIRSFVIARFFRLYPLFWLSIVLVITLDLIMGKPANPLVVLANLTMVPDILNVPRLLDVYWTLAIEMIFYIAAVMLYCAFGQMRLRTAFLTAVGLYVMVALISMVQILGGKGILADRLFLLAVMFTGTTVRVVDAGNRVRLLGILLLCYFVTITMRGYIHFVLFLYAPANEFFNFTSSIVSHGIAAAIFFAGIYSTWTTRPLIFVGRVSYSIYILHPLLILLIDWMVWNHALIATGLYIPVVCTVVIALSAFTYSFVEEPAIRIGKRVSGYFNGPAFAAGSAGSQTSS